jgi:DNA replication and repair protein RecF
VLFAPEDVQLVRGDPSDRRRFLDELLTQRRPAYHAARQEYERVLRQRNALLRTARGRGAPPAATLDTWTDALVAAGSALLAARIAVVHALAGPAERAYAELLADAAGPAAHVRLDYQLSTGRTVTGRPGDGVPDPADLARELRAGLDERAGNEIERGVTLAGPHRDDLLLTLSDLPAKGFASHGETWSLVLALRLASREVLFEVGDEPVVLLDDVFAELDEFRRDRLAKHCRRFGQVLVTAAVNDDVPLEGPRYTVRDRTIITPPELIED